MPNRAWDQRSGEPTEAYKAFVEYRDQGPARSVRTLSRSVIQISEWHRRWKWTRRAMAYDAFVRQTFHEELQRVIQEDARTHAPKLQATLHAMGEFLYDQAQKLASEISRAPISVMKPRDLVVCVEAYAKLRELLAGRPTERVEELRYDVPRLSDEEFEELKRLADKATGEPVLKH